MGEGVGRDFQSQTQPPCQAHKEPAHTPAAALRLLAAPEPVPAAQGTCGSAHRPKPPPAAPPTWSPGLLDTPSPGHTPVCPDRVAPALAPSLPSLPRPLCNQIPKFRSRPGLSQGSLPPPTLPVANRTGSCGGATTWLGPPVPRGLLAGGQAKSGATPPGCCAIRCRGIWGHPASSHVARHTSGQGYGAFFPPLKSWIGHQAPGWRGLVKGEK